MIKSMTGFGKGESNSKQDRITVEIRTVNHRFFDVSSRIPNNLSVLEDKITNYLHKYIKRGKVNVAVLHKKNEKDLSYIKLDEDIVEKHYNTLLKINSKFKLKDDIKLSHLLTFTNILMQEQAECNIALIWPVIEKAMNTAIRDCEKMRQKEGEAMYKDLSRRISIISKHIEAISGHVPELVKSHMDRVSSKIDDLIKSKSVEPDKSRLETELALFARQGDVSEEITRSISHIDSFKKTLLSNEESGRRLEFIIQELQREINTLGSKAGYPKVSKLVVDIKSEIEKMREQIQNVE